MESSGAKCDLVGQEPGAPCPLAVVHSKFEDAHISWHQAKDSYFDPAVFRANLNACIQALRNVTFALQTKKSQIPDFDAWYARWQERMKADAVLKWLGDARTQVVHQGDLETRSVARVFVIASYLEPPCLEKDVPPHLAPEEIARSVSLGEFPDFVRQNGFLRVERRWIADDLPEFELLDALGYAYGFLSGLVDEAHDRLGISGEIQCGARSQPHDENVQPRHQSVLPGRPRCMLTSQGRFVVHLKLQTGELVEIRNVRKAVIGPGHDFSSVISRYGLSNGDVQHEREGVSPLRGLTITYMNLAKRMLNKDGYLVPVAALLLPDHTLEIIQLQIEERGDKYLVWERVAERVRQNGATGVIAVGEAWTAPFDPDDPNRYAGDAPDPHEVISVHAASSDGEILSFVCEFTRREDQISFGPVEEESGGFVGILQPILRVWGAETDGQ